jgi:predicted nuclease of restriction endonuclease-like (RecB) superfamily
MNKKKDLSTTLLFNRISSILNQARSNIIQKVNRQTVLAYWLIGKEISLELQAGKKRAKYGTQLLKNLSEKLKEQYGKGFSTTNLKLFRAFYKTYHDRLSEIGHPQGDESEQKVIGYPMDDQSEPGIGFHPNLSWSHYRALMRVDKTAARQFYEEEAVAGGWSKRQLERQIQSLFYERLLASKDKKRMLLEARNKISSKPQPMDVLKDPYVLEFLDLPDVDRLHESTLESAIISNLQYFLLELGKGFSFVARQKRMRFQDEDFYIDLVFYNFHLKCFLLIDLKIGKLTYQDIGQMDGYLRMFETSFKIEGDNPTIGLVLCSEKNEAIAKYSVLNESKQLFAAKYLTYLPSEEELQKELQRERSLIERKY